MKNIDPKIKDQDLIDHLESNGDYRIIKKLKDQTHYNDDDGSDKKIAIFLDTETTGINPREGHRIVEIGCVEMINRQLTGRTFHAYIKPLDQRGQVFEMDQEVINVHGLTNDFLNDKPIFSEMLVAGSLPEATNNSP